MAFIVLGSAKGAPGTTSAALGLALTWPRPTIIVEADTSGGSSIAAGYLRGYTGHMHTLVELAMANRRGNIEEGLANALGEIPGTNVKMLSAIRNPAQANTVKDLWEPLAAMLTGLEQTGTDVIVDAGRLSAEGSCMPLIRQADQTLLVTRSTLPDLHGARARARSLRDYMTPYGTEERLGMLLVGPNRPFSVKEAQKAVELQVVASIAWDPEGAQVYSDGAKPKRNFDTSPLARSIEVAGGRIRTLIMWRRDRLHTPTGENR